MQIPVLLQSVRSQDNKLPYMYYAANNNLKITDANRSSSRFQLEKLPAKSLHIRM